MLQFSMQVLRRQTTPRFRFSIFNRIFKSNKPKEEAKTAEQPKQQKQTAKQKQMEEEQEYALFDRQKQTLRNVDYSRLKQISKTFPANVGQGGIQEIIFWTEGVEDPDDILRLVEAFNKNWSQQAVQSTVENYKFQQFCARVSKFSYLAKDFESINKLAQFGMLYDVGQTELWKKLEEKLLILLKTQLDLEVVSDIVLKFAKIREGEMIYYKLDDLAEANLQTLSPSSISKILFVMWERETGNVKLIKKYLTRFIESIDQAKPADIVLLSTLLPFIKLSETTLYQEIERRVIGERMLQKLDIPEISVIAKGFGAQNGSSEVWEYIGSEILRHSSLSKNQSEQLLYGPLNSYKLLPDVAKKVTDLVLPHIREMSAASLSELSKIMYIYQLDNQQTYQQIQALVIQQLQDLKLTSLEDLATIAKNYSVTRHGSRDIYRVLEVVITARMQEIKMNRKIFRTIYSTYNKSDLCSAELIKEFSKNL